MALRLSDVRAVPVFSENSEAEAGTHAIASRSGTG